jgi:hypothetical protein
MPDHFHLLISPSIALERAVQFVTVGGTAKAVPFQSHGSEESLTDCGTVEAVPFQNNHERTVSPERHLSNTHK